MRRALAVLLAAAAAAPASASAPARHDRPVPILMYHVIGVRPPGAPNAGLYVAPRVFAAQVQWLARRGYHAVTLEDVYDYWRRGRSLPPRPIVLTFDDGYPGDVDSAMPLLRRHRWPGVLNLQIGNLVPARVRALIRAGWEVDSHTFTHSDLRRESAAQLRRDVAGSRAWIRRVFRVRADFFCYPAGKYDARVVAEVRAAGYLGATTVDEGLARASQLYTLKRIRVSAGDGVAGLARKLSSRP